MYQTALQQQLWLLEQQVMAVGIIINYEKVFSVITSVMISTHESSASIWHFQRVHTIVPHLSGREITEWLLPSGS
jgi:hypothetical protein